MLFFKLTEHTSAPGKFTINGAEKVLHVGVTGTDEAVTQLLELIVRKCFIQTPLPVSGGKDNAEGHFSSGTLPFKIFSFRRYQQGGNLPPSSLGSH